MSFDLPHRVAIVRFLAAVWTLVVFQIRNGIFFTLEAAGPVAANFFDLAASTGRARHNLKHRRRCAIFFEALRPLPRALSSGLL